MYKCTIGNDLKENPKSSFQFNLISCIYIIFVNIEKQESRFFIVITVLRKWVHVEFLWEPLRPADTGLIVQLSLFSFSYVLPLMCEH